MTYNTFTSIPGVTYTSKVYSALYQPKCRMNIYTFTSTLGVTYTSKKCYFCQRAQRNLFSKLKKKLLCCYPVVATCVAKFKTIHPDSSGSKMFPFLFRSEIHLKTFLRRSLIFKKEASRSLPNLISNSYYKSLFQFPIPIELLMVHMQSNSF